MARNFLESYFLLMLLGRTDRKPTETPRCNSKWFFQIAWSDTRPLQIWIDM